MLRQHHVKIQDLAPFLRGYDPSKPQSAEDWSKTESAGFSPGMLLFCLERVSAPQGLAFGKRDDAGETYRVRDLCVVVGKDNNRPLVVNITASAFELRFLEVLMLEKARKAILDGKDFVYVAAKPAQPLSEGKVREIEQLGALYSQGGSRRTLVVDSAGPQEPAVALLGALGVKLQIGGIGKQVLDIGSICHMLYTPEGRQEDRNKMIVKQCFLAIPNTHPVSGDGLTPPAGYTAQPTTSGSNLPAAAPQHFAQSNSGAEPVWQEPIPPTVPPLAPHAPDLYSSAPKAPEWSPVQQPAWGEPSEHGPDLRFSFERTEISTDSSTWRQGGQGYSFPGQPSETGEPANGEPSAPTAQPPQPEPAYEPPAPPPELKYEAPAATPPGGVYHGQADQSETLQHLPGAGLDIQYQMNQMLTQPPEYQYQAPSVPAMQQFQSELEQSAQSSQADFASQSQQDMDQGLAGEASFTHYPGFTEPTGSTADQTSSSPASQNAAMEPATPEPPQGQPSPANQYSKIVQDESQRLDANLLKDISAMAEKARLDGGKTEAQQQWPQPAAAPDLAPPNWEGFTPTGLAAQEITIPPEPPPAEEPDWSTPLAKQQLSPPAVMSLPPVQPAEAAADTGADTAPGELEPAKPAKPQGKSTLFERLNEQFAKVVPAEQEAAEPAATQETTGSDAAARTAAAPTAEFSVTGQPGFAFPGAAQSGLQSTAEAAAQPASIPSFASAAFASLASVPSYPIPPANAIPPAPDSTAPEALSATTSGANQPAVPAPQSDVASPIEQATAGGAEDATTSGGEDDDSSYNNLAAALSGIVEGGFDSRSLLEEEPPAALPPTGQTAPAAADVHTNGGGTDENDADLLAALAGRVNEPRFTAEPPVPPAAQPTVEPPPVVSTAAEPAQAPPESSPVPSQSPFAQTAAAAQAFTAAANTPATSAPVSEIPAAAAEDAPPATPIQTADTNEPPASAAALPSPVAPVQEVAPVPEPVPSTHLAQPEPAATESAPVPAATSTSPAVATALQDAGVAAIPHTSTQDVAIGVAEAQEAAAKVQEGVFQDPRSVMNEMATLMNKLEQQVAKAGKKLNSRADEIRNRLSAQVSELVNAAADVEKTSQASITTTGTAQSKRLDDVSEEVRLKISDVASNGRYTIKQLLAANQTQLEETKTSLYESLRDVCKQFRVDTETLAKDSEEELNRLVTERTEQLQALVNAICERLDDTNKSFAEKLNSRFERFTERMSEEAASVVRSLERNVRSMTEEIDGSWDRASDKLKSSKGEFEQTINHTVRTTQLGISHTTRRLLTETLVPKLRERKLGIRGVSADLNRRFGEESDGQANGQLLGLESSLGAARQQLQGLVEDCMSSIDTVGRGQQAGLEEIFKETSTHAEKATNEVTIALQKGEAQIRETELVCKRLAETSSLDNDPDLTEERNNATARVQQLRQQAMSELSSTIDSGCLRLEALSQKVHTDLSNGRLESTQLVRDAAENGLTLLRDAIQEALAAIQGARDKYME
jgi:hypothetical protein